MSHVKEDYASVPGFSAIPEEEFALYSFSAIPEEEFSLYTRKVALDMIQRAYQSGGTDIAMFWSATSDRLPNIKTLAFRYIHAVTNTADAERSNSLYNLVLSDRRRFLSEDKLKELVFLYFNLAI
ncbi:UNVERIFIED_CONTAM: hypothetical protein FKN15_019567 [Acipenser sinensis]